MKDECLLPSGILLIGFAGKNNSGKTTLAKLLCQVFYNAIDGNFVPELCSFAGALKKCAYEYFNWDGEKDDRGRRLLQWLGTEVGRQYQDDIWIQNLCRHLDNRFNGIRERSSKTIYVVVIDDVRFDNEAQWILDNGGFVFNIDRICNVQMAEHSSESGISPDLITETLDMNNKFMTPELAVEYISEKYFNIKIDEEIIND